jgi:hypothetical protein
MNSQHHFARVIGLLRSNAMRFSCAPIPALIRQYPMCFRARSHLNDPRVSCK